MADNTLPSPPLIPQALECPHCHLPTDRLKVFAVEDYECWVYLVVHRSRALLGCPQCMRRQLLGHLFGSLLPANLLWPFVLLWDALLWLRTFTRGHSRSMVRLVSGEEPKPSEVEIPDALTGAVFGASSGLLAGAVLGMLGGQLCFKYLASASSSVSPDLVGDLGAVTFGLLCALLFAWAAGDVWRTTLLALSGAAAWLAVRWVTEEYLAWRIGGTLFCWAVGGAIVAVLGAARSLALLGVAPSGQCAAVCGLIAGESPAVRSGWGPGTSGAVGGIVGGALAGVLFGCCTGYPLAGVLISAALGGLGGLSGGISLGGQQPGLTPSAGTVQLPGPAPGFKEGESDKVMRGSG